MTYNLQDVSSVDLTGTFTTTNTFDLTHGINPGVSIEAKGNSLLHTLRSLTEADLSAADFVHSGTNYTVHAWEEQSGGLVAWPRATGKVHSGMRDTINADVLFIAVPEGTPVPDPSSTAGPPPAGTSQTVVRVKVSRSGPMPGTP